MSNSRTKFVLHQLAERTIKEARIATANQAVIVTTDGLVVVITSGSAELNAVIRCACPGHLTIGGAFDEAMYSCGRCCVEFETLDSFLKWRREQGATL